MARSARGKESRLHGRGRKNSETGTRSESRIDGQTAQLVTFARHEAHDRYGNCDRGALCVYLLHLDILDTVVVV
jgi:hypothetical protein